MTNVVALDHSTDTENQAIAKLRERFAVVASPDGRDKVRDLENLSTPPHSNPRHLRTSYHAYGGQRPNPSDLFDKLEVIYAETFQPGNPRRFIGPLGNRALNLWTPPDLRPSGTRVTKEQVAPFVEFMVRWFPNQEERKYAWQWITHAVRFPNKRIIATPLLRSDHGTGKGFFAECVMSGLLGKTSVANTTLKSVVGTHNDILEGKTLVIIDELYKNGESTANALKGIQGNKTFTLNRKYLPAISIDNYLNFIVTSNDTVPLDLEPEDRRFWVPQFIKHTVDKSETDRFLNDVLKPWLEDEGGFQMLRDYLEQIPLDDFRSTAPAPMTPSKQEMIGLNPKEELAEFIADQIADALVVKAADIALAFRLEVEQDVSQPAVTKELANKGCKRKKTDRGALWITPKGLAAGLSITSPAGELHKVYEG
ncbi:DUF5906 domain-containing protein [Pseudomonas citronellolis]|uniref:primase-helicase family protein n=1 Tax=Pseudomonas citronellolis TaxID=53408 RepID=UPI0026489F0B|nr:primase-helicase family protein [Pseudomonas citronellolis]MDN6871841.1 DUF5906 domain-containing protein [Pseudomonas citronellolis]